MISDFLASPKVRKSWVEIIARFALNVLSTFLTIFLIVVNTCELSAQTTETSQETQVVKSPVDSAIIYRREYQSFLQKGQMNDAFKAIQMGLRISERLQNDTLQQILLNEAAEAYRLTAKYDSSLIAAERGLALGGTQKHRLYLLNSQATALGLLGDIPKSMSVFKEGIALAKEMGSERSEAGILNNMANILDEKGEYEGALDAYENALVVAESLSDSLLMATALNNIGKVFFVMDQLEVAKSYLNRSLNISTSKNNLPTQILALSNLGYVSLKQQNFEEAQTYFDRISLATKSLNDPVRDIRLKYNIGSAYLKSDRIEEARFYLEDVYNESEKYGVLRGLALSAIDLAKLELKAEVYAKSLEWTEKAIPVAKKLGDYNVLSDLFDIRYSIFKKRNNAKLALENLEEAKKINDSLSVARNEEALAEQRVRLETKQREYEISELKLGQQLQKKELALQQSYLLGGGLTLVLLTVIVIAVSFLSANRKKNNDKLKELNLEISQQRDNLQQVNEEKNNLISLVAHDLRTPMSSMKTLVSLLKSNALNQEEFLKALNLLDERLDVDSSLVQNLLDWAVSHQDDFQSTREDFPIAEIVDTIVREQRPACQAKNVVVEVKTSDEHYANGDAELMKAAVRNVLSNAIKFSNDGGSIYINSLTNNDFVDIVIRDEGVGISEADKHKVFNEVGFTKMGTNREKGSGIGLNLSKQFVENMGGKISFTSEPGQGTEFVISLPKSNLG